MSGALFEKSEYRNLPQSEISSRPQELFARQENKDGSVEGYLGEYLNREFLQGYNEILRLAHPEIVTVSSDGKEAEILSKKIPDILDRIFVPLINLDPEAISVNVTGEVPRAIADNMNPFYWQHFSGLQEDTKMAKQNSKNPHVQKFIASGLGFPTDPDIDITFKTASVKQVSCWLRQMFNIQNEQVSMVEDREQYALFEEPEEDGFIVSIDSGPLKTKPDIVIMFVNIYNKQVVNEKGIPTRLFHIDVGEFPKDVKGAVSDKRVVHSTKKQDECQGKLSVRNDRLYYQLPKEAVEAIRSEEIVHIGDLEDTAELTTRAARISVSHPVEHLLDFDRFIPQFDSGSALDLQAVFREGAAQRNRISEAIKFFVIKELILSFRYDLYQTVQMLRDSGLSTMIPGLDHLTTFDFDETLRSNSFSIEMKDMRPTPYIYRDETYIKRQRQLYRKEVEPGKQNYTDGLERFIDALVELEYLPQSVKEDYWGAFFNLFYEPESFQIQIIEPERKQTFSSQNYALIRGAGGRRYFLLPENKSQITTEEIEDTALQIVENLPPRPEGTNDIMDIISEINSVADDALKQDIELFLRWHRKSKPSEVVLLQWSEAKNRVYSLAYLYKILRRYSSGLTPRHLGQMYSRQKGRFRKQPFPDTFAQFKRLGKTDRFERDRVHSFTQELVPVDFYFPFAQGSAQHSLHDLLEQLGKKEKQELVNLYNLQRNGGRSRGPTVAIKGLKKTINALTHAGISLEAIESFVEQDLDILVRLGHLPEYLKSRVFRLRDALRQFYARPYIAGDSVPDVYKTTYRSLDGKNIIQDYRNLMVTAHNALQTD